MKLKIIRAPESLQFVVNRLVIIEAGGEFEITVKAFPVGYPFINVISEGQFRIESKDANHNLTSYLCGQTTKPFDLRISFGKRTLLFQFHPWAIPLLFKQSASGFVNQQISLYNIDQNLSRKLEKISASNLEIAEIANECFRLFESLVSKTQMDTRVLKLWSKIFQTRGIQKMSAIMSDLGVSQRRLEQLFVFNVGIAPKTYSRIVRVQYKMYIRSRYSKFDQALLDGYFDQAHFGRELKSQTGMAMKELDVLMTNRGMNEAYQASNLFANYSQLVEPIAQDIP